MFVRDRMRLRGNTEDFYMWVRAWDFAGSADGDWTVGVMMGKNPQGAASWLAT
jgi:phage terminase large subunit-like protein